MWIFIWWTLDLSQRVDAVKDENVKLKSENQVSSQIPFQIEGNF